MIPIREHVARIGDVARGTGTRVRSLDATGTAVDGGAILEVPILRRGVELVAVDLAGGEAPLRPVDAARHLVDVLGAIGRDAEGHAEAQPENDAETESESQRASPFQAHFRMPASHGLPTKPIP